VPLNGVRSAAIACRRAAAGAKMECAMAAVSLRESVQMVSDPRNLDASVEEVFGMMLGIHCEHVGGDVAPERSPESVTAVVGFGGLLSGACVFRCDSKAALGIAGAMTGMDFAEIDDTVKDGIGEICNMLAGAWKGKVPELSANCGLSVPAVITGRDYNLHVQAPEFQIHHIFTFGSEYFEVMIVCDGLQ
jgi:chemotaxis protein CheX